MWSLFKREVSENSENSSGIFDFSGEKLEPIKFSNGKTQADIVKEILDAIEQGNKIIFIKGVCGSGKSAIALNLARHFKKTSIVVPIKSLQEQYEEDYTKNKFILKQDNQKLKISVIKGRNNFNCPFCGGKADAGDLPCTIELREKNIEQIKKYLEQNSNVDKSDFSAMGEVRRMSVAPACPFWSPLLPSGVSAKAVEKAKKLKYKSVSGEEYALFQRKKGCAYNDQYEAYVDSDVLIFNSLKYLLELIMGRKPKTDIDIIDECDEFLDNFSNEKTINLNRLLYALSNLNPEKSEQKNEVKKMTLKVNSLLYEQTSNEIERLGKSSIEPLIEQILENPYLAEDEEDNYYNKVFEIAKAFETLLDETYVLISKKSDQSYEFSKYIKENREDNVILNLVTINLAKKFEYLVNSTEVLVLMSGTLHSEIILKDIFGLKNFKIIEAETQNPGTITKFRTGMEKNCKYENFKNKIVTREQYLKALSSCVTSAKLPALVHVNSFEDLPNELEKAEFNLTNVITKERLKALQEGDTNNREIEKFRIGEIDVLFTTKCSRGIDFPGDKCNSIILTKYPYPNTQSLFWQILKKERPNDFMTFYLDKAKRELLQKIYRGLRFKDDHIILLSPDSRVLDTIFK
ncbi:MAG: helicase C-terminal domain-containing protein [Nanoarchaeota archaeon]|nr:helicase C-terminal domain-containing protein [Nanoarchaeota archaeon]